MKSKFPYGHEYWFHEYRRYFSVLIAEAIREHRKFSLLNNMELKDERTN